MNSEEEASRGMSSEKTKSKEPMTRQAKHIIPLHLKFRTVTLDLLHMPYHQVPRFVLITDHRAIRPR